MKLTRYAVYAAMSLAMVAFASCKKDNPDNGKDPEPDPVVPVEIYFSAENGDYCFYAAPGTSAEVEVQLVRLDAAKADSYSIKVNSASNGITIPETVSFGAGQETATLKITTPATAQALDKFDFDISLTGENVKTSASSDQGTIRCEGTVYVYEERTAVGSFDNGATSHMYMGYFKQTVWRLADNKMILKNFLGSGNDLSFKYADEWTPWYGYSIDAVDYTGTDYIYPLDDSENPGSYSLYFYHEIDKENGEYEEFKPKGDQRYIYGLGIYLGNAYSAYFKDDTNDYLFFTCPVVNIYGESECIDKGYTWLYYLYFNFVDESKLSNYDFEGFPEIKISEYPEAKTDVTAGDGEKVLNFKFYYGEFDMDSQVAKVETVDGGTKYTIEDLWYSKASVSFTMNSDGSVTVDGGSKAYLDEDGKYYFYDLTGDAWDNFWWYSDYDRCVTSLYLTNPGDAYYNYWGDGYAYIAISYQYYNGSDYSEAATDYIKITW